MANKTTLFILIIALLASCNPMPDNSLSDFSINGSVDTVFDGSVFLKKRQGGQWLDLDTAELIDGKFAFVGKIGFPERYYIQIPSQKILVPFFIEGSDIDMYIIHNDLNTSSITGSKSQDDYEDYLDAVERFDEKLNALYKEFRKAKNDGDTAKQNKLDKGMDEIYAKKDDFIVEYIQANNTSPVAPYIATRNYYSWDLELLNTVVNSFDASLDASVYKKLLANRARILEKLAIGKPFIPFTLPDTSGVELAIADIYKGKYLLIDFWASWCGPCRRENPNIVACYEDFHDKGFEILGVSLDSDGTKWEEAIRDDNLTWYHVSDLKRWQSDAGKLYGIISIPSSLLLDPDGYIIARNLKGEDLRAKLEELMD